MTTLVASTRALPPLRRSVPLARQSTYGLDRLVNGEVGALELSPEQIHGDADVNTLDADTIKKNVAKASQKLQSAVASFHRSHPNKPKMTVRTFKLEDGTLAVGVWLAPVDAAPADAPAEAPAA